MNTVNELRNCIRCGKLYTQEGLLVDVCKDCFDTREEEFHAIRKLLQQNPGISAMELSRRTDIPIQKILYWIRDGRLRTN